MTREEAKLLLQAHRPNGLDDTHPHFAEAMVLAQSDPELKAWWEAQQAFDRKVAARLDAIPVPAYLRATLLAERKVILFPQWPALPYWLAAAAVLAVLVVIGNILPVPSHALASNEYSAEVLPYLGDDKPDLAMISPDHEKVVAWLKEQHSPTGDLPTKMTVLPSVGCRTLAVHGHQVSLICFAMAGGGVAHLFIVDKKALTDPPPLASPQFSQRPGGWSTAEWSDENKSYILATRAGADALKNLL